MTKETLMEWGLTEEQAGKVLEGLNSSFVAKTRLSELNAELKAAKDAIKERDSQLETLKKSTGDTEALQQQIAQLQADNAQKDKKHAEELKALQVSAAVDLALTSAKARNNTAVKALLGDFLSKAELAGDGMVKGLEDELKKMAGDEKTEFLFEKVPDKRFKGVKPAQRSDKQNSGEMTLEAFRSLSPAERYAFSANYPEEYRRLYEGNEHMD